MCSLSGFPDPPAKGLTTLYEQHGHLHSGTEQEWANFGQQLTTYRCISVARETVRSSVSSDSTAPPFLLQHESIWRQAVNSWRDKGFIGFLEQLARYRETSPAWSLARFAAKSLMVGMNWFYSHGLIFPHLLLSGEALCQEYSLALDWGRGHVRAFAWHPQTPKFAVASHGDLVRVYAPNVGIVPLLKHKSQRNITDMAWKPYCSSLLAVACQDGVVLWQLDPMPLIGRPSSAHASLLSRRGHQPVTSVAWHPKGSLLASASPADSSMLIWNVSTEECVPLCRLAGGGVCLLRWSPDGAHLLAAAPQSLFRVWDTQFWRCDRWSTFQGRCQAACWSPDGAQLLCAFSNSPALYAVSFPKPLNPCLGDEEEDSAWIPHSSAGSGSGLPVVDLAEVTLSALSGHPGNIKVGGTVQNMAWDKHGERLAVSFRDHGQYVALFCTRTYPMLEVSPCGFISGPHGEHAQLLSFYNGFEGGSLLTVCWSNGVVSHVPLYYCPLSQEPTEKSFAASPFPLQRIIGSPLYSS
uniref:Putative aladin n=2 Tax=Ixodes ricinus TaxID=34613 RepID=V5I152_IXORI